DRDQHEHLPATAETERALVPELDEVIEEAHAAAGERSAENRQRGRREVRQRQEGDRGRGQDQKAAHRRRPLLRDVVLRTLGADVLAELVPAQERNEGWPAED